MFTARCGDTFKTSTSLSPGQVNPKTSEWSSLRPPADPYHRDVLCRTPQSGTHQEDSSGHCTVCVNCSNQLDSSGHCTVERDVAPW